ncbi:unnamed protein product, partial [Pylaiella littoralis]
PAALWTFTLLARVHAAVIAANICGRSGGKHGGLGSTPQLRTLVTCFTVNQAGILIMPRQGIVGFNRPSRHIGWGGVMIVHAAAGVYFVLARLQSRHGACRVSTEPGREGGREGGE